jgi:hypothetical protein
MTTTDTLRHHLDTISASTATAAEALADSGAALDLPPRVLAELLLEVETLAGRLDLVLDSLATAADPAGVMTGAP